MKSLSCLFLLSAALLLTACYKDIDMERYRPESTLVLNSVLSPDTVVMAQVARTVFFTEHRDADTHVPDAEVRMSVNGTFVETLRYDAESQMYLSSFRPDVGDEVGLEAVCSLGRASGKGVIPRAVPVDHIEVTVRTFEDPDQIIWTTGGPAYGKSYEATYRITFTDEPAERNFYFIRIEGEHGLAAETLDYSHDDVFLAQQSSVDGMTTDTEIKGNEGRTFTDDLFDGSRYTLKIVQKAPLYEYGDKSESRKIILYSLSEAYYHYLTGIFNTDEESVSGNLVDLGFSEPSPHYSNIEGGTGIVGAVQSYSARVNFKMP